MPSLRRRVAVLVLSTAVLALLWWLFQRDTHPVEVQTPPLSGSVAETTLARLAPLPPEAEDADGVDDEPSDEECAETRSKLNEVALGSLARCGAPAFQAACLRRPMSAEWVEANEEPAHRLVLESCGAPAVSVDCTEHPCIVTLPEGCEPGFTGGGRKAVGLDLYDFDDRPIAYISSHGEGGSVSLQETASYAEHVRRRLDHAPRFGTNRDDAPEVQADPACAEEASRVLQGEGPECAALALLNGCPIDAIQPDPPPHASTLEEMLEDCPELAEQDWALDCSLSPCVAAIEGSLDVFPCAADLPPEVLARRGPPTPTRGQESTMFWLFTPEEKAKYWDGAFFFLGTYALQRQMLLERELYGHGSPPLVNGMIIPHLAP